MFTVEHRRWRMGPRSTSRRSAAAGPLHRCGCCWLDLAREAGAEVAVVTVVHKVSELLG